jgi:DNA recombination protein RmuC
MELIFALIVGILVGGLACWLIQEFRAKARLARMESDHRAEAAGLRGQLEQIDSANKILDTAKEQLSEVFQATAGRALQSNNELFMNVARENLGKTLESAKGEFNQRHEQFQALVKPLAQNYEKLNPQIESLILQSQSLAAETGKLSNALTNNRQIGSWGEIQLRRVVELAGMTEHCDFVEQTTVNGSNDRPDLTVKLPEKRTVVVDAKASTAAYMEAQQTGDESASAEALRRHAGALRTQVDDLARKNYGAHVEGSLDFVVMFVPGDQFLAAALNANPSLVEYAMSKRVAIATPASLISLLWAVANGWQRFRIAENAETIRQAGEEMHQRMQAFIGHYQRVGRELRSAVDAYNNSVGSFDSRVMPQGRRFAQLVTDKEDDFPQPQAIEKVVSTSRYADAPAYSPRSED